MGYNLIDRPAVAALYKEDGTVKKRGLRALMRHCGDIVSLVVPTPTMWPALLRQVLLPIHWHALHFPTSPQAWRERFEQSSYSDADLAKLDAYFEQYRDRFDLFDEQRPFGQTPGLRAASGEVKPTSQLMPHLASGNNVPLFSAFTDGNSPVLQPMEAFGYLLHCQCWDTAAIKTGAEGDPAVRQGKTTGNHTGPLGQLGVVIPAGNTLYETLMLNTPVRRGDVDPSDVPPWAREHPEGPGWRTRAATGLIDLCTFAARRIRLHHIPGDDGPVVTGVVVTAGDRLTETPEFEPHTLWNRVAKPKPGQPARMPRRHRRGTAAWRSLQALLTLSYDMDGPATSTAGALAQIADLAELGVLSDDYPLRVMIAGVEYGTQSAVVTDSIADEIPVPVAALTVHGTLVRDYLMEVVAQADRIRAALNHCHNDVRASTGGQSLDPNRGGLIGDDFIAALAPPAKRLLAGFGRCDGDEAQLEAGMVAWEETVRDRAFGLVDRLIDAVPAGNLIAVEGHNRPRTAVMDVRRAFTTVLNRTLTRTAAPATAAAGRSTDE